MQDKAVGSRPNAYKGGVLSVKKTPQRRTKRAKVKPPEGRKLALLCAKAALDKKAEDPVVLDIRKLSSFADYFVICHGTSARQVQAISEHVREQVLKAGVRILGEEGIPEGRWALLDAGDVVVHVFDEPVRKFYDLERLWIHAPEVKAPKG